MNHEDALSALQLAINQLVTASAGVFRSDISPGDIGDELSVSIDTDQGVHEIVVFEDGGVMFTPSKPDIKNVFLRDWRFPRLSGRPQE